jgi:hypothetical protein
VGEYPGFSNDDVEVVHRHETRMVWKIVRYLVQQGYNTEDIVVLTPYLGQLRELRETLKNDADPVLAELDALELNKAGFGNVTSKARNKLRMATIGMRPHFLSVYISD